MTKCFSKCVFEFDDLLKVVCTVHPLAAAIQVHTDTRR